MVQSQLRLPRYPERGQGVNAVTDDTSDDETFESFDSEHVGGPTGNGNAPPDGPRPPTDTGSNGDSDGDDGTDADRPGGRGDETAPDAERAAEGSTDTSTATAPTVSGDDGPTFGGDGPAFVEVQRYRQRWLWAMILGISALAVATVAFRTPSLPVTAALVVVPLLGIPLTYRANLRTEVREDGVYLRLMPFHRSFREVPFEDVLEFEARSFNPGRDFGGIGIRRTPGGWAYIVSGGDGVTIEREGEPKITIGSRRPEDLERAIAGGIARNRGAINQEGQAPRWKAVADFTADDDAE